MVASGTGSTMTTDESGKQTAAQTSPGAHG
jgi:hypothetical protein